MKIIHWAIMFVILMVFTGTLQSSPIEGISTDTAIENGSDAPEASIENTDSDFRSETNHISNTIVVYYEGTSILKLPQVRRFDYSLFAPNCYAGYWDVRLNANKNKFII